MFIRLDRMYKCDKHTHRHTALWHRPHMQSIAQQKCYLITKPISIIKDDKDDKELGFT